MCKLHHVLKGVLVSLQCDIISTDGRNQDVAVLKTITHNSIMRPFEKTKHKAILTGKNSDFLEIKYLKQRVFLFDKDRLVTSGDGGLLPRGLIVGEYFKNLNDDLNKIKILPTRNWDKLNNLNVILFKHKKTIEK